jgi:hypothetical protein
VLPAQLSVSNGEPSSETQFDTSRIQDALDNCASGQAVELAASNNNYGFLIQPIKIPSGVTLLVDAGVTVFASRNPADYQQGSGATCGVVSAAGGGCRPLIKSSGTTGSGIMGYGIIDGRGWDDLIVNGAVQSYSWYANTQTAYIPRPVLNQNNFDMVDLSQANNFTFYKITLKDSPEFNIHWYGQNGGSITSGLTIWGIKIISPNNMSNTDGIDPTDNSQNVTITDSYISNGDDNIAISSTSPGNPMSNVSITNLHTYAGFGISIGSHTEGGINNVLVDTINQAGYYPNTGSAGLKIKSSSDRGGVVNNVTYQHICQQNERFAIRIYPYYTNPSTTAYIPTYTNISVHDVTVLADSSGSSGRFVFQGYDANHMTTLWLDNLNVMGTPDTSSNAPQDVAITLAGPVNPSALQQLSGTGVSYAGSAPASTETPYPCSTSNFQQITGELLLSTAAGTNLQSLSVSPSDTFTLNAVVQPATAESAALSNPITFYDGGTAVGTAAISGNGTLATLSLSNVSSGTHTYTAQYPADSNYSSFSFGGVTVNVSGSTTTPPTSPTTPNTSFPADRRRLQRSGHAGNYPGRRLYRPGHSHLLQPSGIHHLQCHTAGTHLRRSPQRGNRHHRCGRQHADGCFRGPHAKPYRGRGCLSASRVSASAAGQQTPPLHALPDRPRGGRPLLHRLQHSPGSCANCHRRDRHLHQHVRQHRHHYAGQSHNS